MGRTSDARKEIMIASPGRLGGAGRAHVEGEWLGRMFRAGRHVPWSPEGRGPGSARGATLLVVGWQPPARTIGIWPEFRVQFWKAEGL